MTAQIRPEDLKTWAGYLIDHALGGVSADDVIMLKGEHITWPLMSVLQDEIFARGGIADINLVAPDNDRGRVFGASIARHGTTAQIARTPAWHGQRYEAMTKYLEILGAERPELFVGLPAETAQALAAEDEPYKNARLLKPWVLTLFPTPAFAAMDEMSLEEYTEVVVSASTTDPRVLEQVEEPIHARLQQTERVRVVTEDPRTGKELELTMSIAGRNVVKCVGRRNFPDGEVFTSPDARTVGGEIFVDMPVSYGGVTIRGVYLRFADGVIQEYAALEGGEALRAIIETDDGSHRLGEVAFGMNAGLTKVLRHPLFVEKVGGTLHIAIGASYPECFVDDPASDAGQAKIAALRERGVYNKSAQHVDIVTDFRGGGTGRAVYLDDTKLEVRENLWVIPA